MFDERIDPPDDEMPWGEDFEGEEVPQGTEGWDTDEGFVPNEKEKLNSYMDLVGHRTIAED
ncbi:hypothetical protein LIQ99_11675 [Weissella cibaria]|uniref:hypothetical protein n=1 Tax=Weissella cibaria TaxID=137591 RepID=UPI001D037DD0|nr:hypothetical protein [Weissella cibaria]MCB5827555.1 hypothetical protein [Weissella cibaria]MCB5858074.1 hypothetical protein [Weissella cibaria]MCB5860300.1 hypothetical protein [Weissella cibaria]MCB5862708.1 hypothetical protein [Weissella cibaria]MCB5864817.1 hypothetical protein [Weissella cibaria]